MALCYDTQLEEEEKQEEDKIMSTPVASDLEGEVQHHIQTFDWSEYLTPIVNVMGTRSMEIVDAKIDAMHKVRKSGISDNQ